MKEVYIPKLGQTVEEVVLVRWLVEDGALVAVGQEILEVETDKAIFAVEATGKGALHIDPAYKPGDVLPVLTVVGSIGKNQEPRTENQSSLSTIGSSMMINDRRGEAAVGDTPNLAQTSVSPPLRPSGGDDQRRFASPRARRLAAQGNVNLAALTPTGGGGARIAERDVRGALAARAAQPVQSVPQAPPAPPKATPLAQRIAAATGVDLRALNGSGPGGRITRDDVLGDREQQTGNSGQGTADREQESDDTEQSTTLIDPNVSTLNRQSEIVNRKLLTGIRKVIAQRMAASSRTAARVTLMREVDATEFVAMRARLKARTAAAWGFAPGYNDLIAKIVAGALRAFPALNARIEDDAIAELAAVNIGVAVDTERGLLVPVVRDVDAKSVRQFGAEFRALVAQARSGRISPDDLRGGTFTITNLGMFGVDAFTPIINLPEAAILGLGRIVEKPVIRGGAVVARQMWTLSLAFDHRLTDGAPAARFLAHIAEVIEEPYLLAVA